MSWRRVLPVEKWLPGCLAVLAMALAADARAAIPCAARSEHGERTSYRGCDAGAAPAPRSADGARALLRRHAPELGLGPDAAELELVASKHGLSGSVARFRQRFRDRPVFGAWVTVSQGPHGALRGLHSAFRKGASLRVTPGAAKARLSRADAISAAHAVFGVASLRSPVRTQRVWMPGADSQLIPAWEVMSFAREPLGDYLVVVDEVTGEALFKQDLIAFDSGSGLVYQPNPIQTSGSTAFTDSGDATTAALNAERVNVTLLGLDGGTGFLRGEFVDLVTLPGGLAVPDANEPTRVYAYTRADDRFEQVVVYHAVDSAQRYFHSLGFDDHAGLPNGIRDFPTLAHAHWYTQDQSFYSTGDDAIHFGDGGVDDAEDADIILHEYGHAVQFDQNICWGGGEMGAMGEGFGDYLAASYWADFGNATHQASHAACVGEWDATSYSGTNPPCLRRVDGSKIYPNNLVGKVHADGEIWSRALWDLRAGLGAATADQLILEHHFSLTCNASMTDAALEILDVNGVLNGGAGEGAIRTAFCNRGVLSGSECVFSFDLELVKTASPGPVAPGGRLEYTLTAENNTAGTLTGLSLSDTLPADTSYLPWSASDGGTVAGGVVSWPAFELLSGQAATRKFSVAVNPGLSGPNVLFSDDVEGGGAAWAAAHSAGSDDWSMTTLNPFSGSFSWGANAVAGISDQTLTLTPPFVLPSDATLHFWHRHITENGRDGGVVEISIDGSPWSDLAAAFSVNGYNGVISSVHGSPIAGRLAFTGDNGAYAESVVDLGFFAGFSAQFRFRLATDTSVAGVGWQVDDISLVSQPTITNSAAIVALEGDDATAEITTDVVGSPASCGDGLVAPGSNESCDDANAIDGDGCNSCRIALYGEPVCGSGGALCDSLSFFGSATGTGQLTVEVDGVTLIVVVLPGYTAGDVAAATAQAINFDPTLTGLGVSAQALGGFVVTTGAFGEVGEDVPGLSFSLVVPALPVAGLVALAVGLIASVARRRLR